LEKLKLNFVSADTDSLPPKMSGDDLNMPETFHCIHNCTESMSEYRPCSTHMMMVSNGPD
jgi:hypothetical protein